MADLSRIVDETVRRERGRIVATLVRLAGSVDVAEDAFQKAVVAAIERWRTALPENPGAWLTTTARRALIDANRRRSVADGHAADVSGGEQLVDDPIDTVTDDYLRLIVACCHPELSISGQIALTLKLVAGFTTDEIARAFGAREATVSQRILRARRVLERDPSGHRPPEPRELQARVHGVLGVLYAMFNEGHVASRGPLVRIDLQAEALRLVRIVADLAPCEPEVFGALAIMAFAAARAHTRIDAEGAPILLADQDRSRWDRELVHEGLMALARARTLGGRGPFVLQAEIAAVHTTAPTWQDTDWSSILARYDQLLELPHAPVVALDRAIALAMIAGPAIGLEAIATIEHALADHHLLHATRAEFIAQTGGDPVPAIRRALELVVNDGERLLLERRLAQALVRRT